ncbi:MAG: 30S ribosomal protein S27ae [archaeon GB-1867-097]|nr:30S ribosomal protein S27ae [Candidatus Verstraetearchaeota archaeon]MCS7373939.1 30S ribosomal protein S27ae [Candidatus Culexmicrobium thermophilum]MCS7384793.1 30S ribosomal protein S27ae [Candidatus Culexmicrobium thermophilum]RLE57526.1 MAG: 30S ribosomal protein S27ae [Candidatus Verstraetearchaeota archaeon]
MVRRHQLYEYDYSTGKIILKRKLCPRCKRVMAFHGDRYACGFCGYTLFIKKNKS